MIKDIIELLKAKEGASDSELINIAKGKYKTPTTLKEIKQWLILRK